MGKLRVFRFTPDMLEKVKSGRKTVTSRPSRHEGLYEVGRGSWFNPERFGICVELTPVVEHKLPVSQIAVKYYREEGFDSPYGYLKKLKEIYPKGVPTEMWLHHVKVVSCEGDEHGGISQPS